MRLVPASVPEPLSIDDARDGAKTAYFKARAAQRELVSDVGRFLNLIYRPGSVGYYRLKSERIEARRQVERAQAVLDAIDSSIASMESAHLNTEATE